MVCARVCVRAGGIKLFDFTIDRQFWIELRNKSAVVVIVLYLISTRLWRLIQEERNWQNKPKRSISEKFLWKKNAALEQNEALLKRELARTKSQVRKRS